MSGSRIDPSIKIRMIKKYLDKTARLSKAAGEAGGCYATAQEWASLDRNEEPAGRIGHGANAVYREELKRQAVEAYVEQKNLQTVDEVKKRNCGSCIKRTLQR